MWRPLYHAMNDETIFDVVKAVAACGALSANYIVVRLNNFNGIIFEDWVRKNFPDRANKGLGPNHDHAWRQIKRFNFWAENARRGQVCRVGKATVCACQKEIPVGPQLSANQF